MKHVAWAEVKDNWFDCKLENDPRFLRRIAEARASLKAGKGIPWEQIESGEDQQRTKSAARSKTRTPKSQSAIRNP